MQYHTYLIQINIINKIYHTLPVLIPQVDHSRLVLKRRKGGEVRVRGNGAGMLIRQVYYQPDLWRGERGELAAG